MVWRDGRGFLWSLLADQAVCTVPSLCSSRSFRLCLLSASPTPAATPDSALASLCLSQDPLMGSARWGVIFSQPVWYPEKSYHVSMEVTELIVTAMSQEGETEGGTEQDRKWEHLMRKHLSELSFHC